MSFSGDMPPLGVMGGRGGRIANRVRFQILDKGRTYRVVRYKSQKLELQMPLVCNDCGREYVRKRDGSCSTCDSTEFVFILTDGRPAYVDFSDNFTRVIPTQGEG